MRAPPRPCRSCASASIPRRLADDLDEGVVQPGPLDRQSLDAGAAVDQRLQQRLDPRLLGQLETPASPSPLGIRRQRSRRRRRRRGAYSAPASAAVARASPTVPSNRPLPPAMIAIRSHSRSAWAMTWVEKMTVAPARRLVADQLLRAALVDRVEAGERLVEHDQLRACGRSCRAAGRSAPCPWTALDRSCRHTSPSPFCRATSRRACAPSSSGRPRSAPMKAIASRAFIAG